MKRWRARPLRTQLLKCLIRRCSRSSRISLRRHRSRILHPQFQRYRNNPTRRIRKPRRLKRQIFRYRRPRFWTQLPCRNRRSKRKPRWKRQVKRPNRGPPRVSLQRPRLRRHPMRKRHRISSRQLHLGTLKRPRCNKKNSRHQRRKKLPPKLSQKRRRRAGRLKRPCVLNLDQTGPHLSPRRRLQILQKAQTQLWSTMLL